MCRLNLMGFYNLEVTSKHHLTQILPTNSFRFQKGHTTIENVVIQPYSSIKSQLHHPAEDTTFGLL